MSDKGNATSCVLEEPFVQRMILEQKALLIGMKNKNNMEMKEMNEKININVDNVDGELVIRHGDARKLLDEKEPLAMSQRGTIGIVREYLEKRSFPGGLCNGFVREKEIDNAIAYMPETVRWCQCRLCVNRDRMIMTLFVDERDARKRTEVIGCIETSKELEKWHINDDEYQWTPEELGKFVKMNRSAFTDKAEAMKLTSDLMHFRANVKSDHEKWQEESGSKGDNYSQIVESNVPKSFKISIPVIKGMQKYDIEVETFADINGRDVRFSLISPSAQELIDEIKDNVIDQEIAKIKEISDEIADGLAIMEV